MIILYGIDENAEHDYKTVQEIKKIQQNYCRNFYFIDLSEHLKGSEFTGSHRKLLIKDNDYYISGSFNFLSFAKHEGERIANEESQLITINVKEKWERIIKDYKLSIQPPTGISPNENVNVSQNFIEKDTGTTNQHSSKKNEGPIISNEERAKSFKTNDNFTNNSTGANRLTKKK